MTGRYVAVASWTALNLPTQRIDVESPYHELHKY